MARNVRVAQEVCIAMHAISAPPQPENGAAGSSPPPPTRVPTRTLVIGLGNPLVSDDRVGLQIAACLRDRLAARSDIDVAQDYWGGLRLMERMIGYRRAIVIDAISTGAAPGTIHHATIGMFNTHRSASAHDVDLPTALAFGRAAGALLPADDDVRLVGIEAADLVHFSEQCTPHVEAAIGRAVQEIVQQLDLLQEGPSPC